jgi:hypothetical protein
MSNSSEIGLIGYESSELSNKTDNSSKNASGNLLNVQSVVLDKILDDPQTKDVVVMEVFIHISIFQIKKTKQTF